VAGREGFAHRRRKPVPLAWRQPRDLGDLVVSGHRNPRAGTFEAHQVDPDTRAAIRIVLNPHGLAQARGVHGHPGFLAHLPRRGLRVALPGFGHTAGEKEHIASVRPDTENLIASTMQPDRGDHYRGLRRVHSAGRV
jgi:hypothetical protein